MKQASVSSTDQRGGKRRAICRLAAKPPEKRNNRRLCLVPIRAASARARYTYTATLGVGPTPERPLHGPTADKHTLSLAPLLPIFAFYRFGGKRRSLIVETARLQQYLMGSPRSWSRFSAFCVTPVTS